MDLCDNDILATASVLWETGCVSREKQIAFEAFLDSLVIQKDEDWIRMSFPAEPAVASMPVPGLGQALVIEPLYTGRNRFDILVELPLADDVCSLEHDMNALAAIQTPGIIVTAVSDQPHINFVFRFFAPSVGMPDDTVTGSAHCCLVPYRG